MKVTIPFNNFKFKFRLGFYFWLLIFTLLKTKCIFTFRWANKISQWTHSEEQRQGTLQQVHAWSVRLHQVRMFKRSWRPKPSYQGHCRNTDNNYRLKRRADNMAGTASSPLQHAGLTGLQCLRGNVDYWTQLWVDTILITIHEKTLLIGPILILWVLQISFTRCPRKLKSREK